MQQAVDLIAEQSQDRTVPIGVVKDWVQKLKIYQETLLKTVQSLQAIEVGLRVELVELQPYEYTMEESVQFALENRLDLKNEQARVMDARRRVEVAANAGTAKVAPHDAQRPFRPAMAAGKSYPAPQPGQEA